MEQETNTSHSSEEDASALELSDQIKFLSCANLVARATNMMEQRGRGHLSVFDAYYREMDISDGFIVFVSCSILVLGLCIAWRSVVKFCKTGQTMYKISTSDSTRYDDTSKFNQMEGTNATEPRTLTRVVTESDKIETTSFLQKVSPLRKSSTSTRIKWTKSEFLTHTTALTPNIATTYSLHNDEKSPSSHSGSDTTTRIKNVTMLTYQTQKTKVLTTGSKMPFRQENITTTAMPFEVSSIMIPEVFPESPNPSTEDTRTYLTHTAASHARKSSISVKVTEENVTISSDSKDTAVSYYTNRIPTLVSVLSTNGKASNTATRMSFVKETSTIILTEVTGYLDNSTSTLHIRNIGTRNYSDSKLNLKLAIGLSCGAVVIIFTAILLLVFRYRKRNALSKQRLTDDVNDRVVPFNDFDIHHSQQSEDLSGYEMSQNIDEETRKYEQGTDQRDKTYEVLRHVETGEMDYEVLKRSEIPNNGYVYYRRQGLYANVLDVDENQQTLSYHLDISTENQYANLQKVHPSF